jgi:hypothetical protein
VCKILPFPVTGTIHCSIISKEISVDDAHEVVSRLNISVNRSGVRRLKRAISITYVK